MAKRKPLELDRLEDYKKGQHTPPASDPAPDGVGGTADPEAEQTPDVFKRVNITMRESDLKKLDDFIKHLIALGEMDNENRSFLIRRALKALYREYGF